MSCEEFLAVRAQEKFKAKHRLKAEKRCKTLEAKYKRGE